MPIQKRVLIVTSVKAEQEAVIRGLRDTEGVDVLIGGVGPVASAVSTAMHLAKATYSCVVNVGIGGGFSHYTDLGHVVVADEIIAADLGSETLDSFLSLDELGFGKTRIAVEPIYLESVIEALKKENFPVVKGPILTVSTATGTAQTAKQRQTRFPKAVAEGMEGFGVATAAKAYGLPALEIRTISNFVGPRNKEAWKIKEALEMIEKTMKTLRKVLLP